MSLLDLLDLEARVLKLPEINNREVLEAWRGFCTGERTSPCPHRSIIECSLLSFISFATANKKSEPSFFLGGCWYLSVLRSHEHVFASDACGGLFFAGHRAERAERVGSRCSVVRHHLLPSREVFLYLLCVIQIDDCSQAAAFQGFLCVPGTL